MKKGQAILIYLAILWLLYLFIRELPHASWLERSLDLLGLALVGYLLLGLIRSTAQDPPQPVSYQAIVHSMGDLVYTLDREQRHVGVYGRWLENGPFRADQLLGKTAAEIWGPEAGQLHRQANEKALQGETVVYDWSFASEGAVRYYQTSVSPLRNHDKGEIIGIVGIGRDITKWKEQASQAEYLAYHDALTGLPNRRLLERSFHQHMAQAEDQPFAVLFVDLDQFKQINDTYGHDFGDKLLQIAAQRLSHCIREQDIVCRIGGDEFVILLAPIDREAARLVAERILSVFAHPFQLGQQEFSLSPSIGISLYPCHGESLDTLIKHADSAMYQVKKNGKNDMQFFADDRAAL